MAFKRDQGICGCLFVCLYVVIGAAVGGMPEWIETPDWLTCLIPWSMNPLFLLAASEEEPWLANCDHVLDDVGVVLFSL